MFVGNQKDVTMVVSRVSAYKKAAPRGDLTRRWLIGQKHGAVEKGGLKCLSPRRDRIINNAKKRLRQCGVDLAASAFSSNN
jgi:hypothetical protein